MEGFNVQKYTECENVQNIQSEIFVKTYIVRNKFLFKH